MTATIRPAEAEVRAVLEAKVAATRARDANRAAAFFSPDAVAYDVVDPLAYSGVDAIRARAAEWFATFSDASIGYDLAQVRIAVDGDVAYSHSLNHAHGALTNGGKLDMWWRETLCFEKRQGRWSITHAHDSVPFDPETGKPSLGLRP